MLRPFERAETNRRGSVRIRQGLVPIGNGQAPGMTTGRGVDGAAGGGAAGLRPAGFLRAAGLRRTAFFFAAFFFPARLFAFAIRSSSQASPGGGLRSEEHTSELQSL